MAKFTAKTPIKHDGKGYSVGDALTLNDKDAAELLALGAVKEAKASTSDKAAAAQAAAAQAAADQGKQ